MRQEEITKQLLQIGIFGLMIFVALIVSFFTQ